MRQKVQRLGLEVDEQRKKIRCLSTTTAELVLPKELFSVEEVLKELHAAVRVLKALESLGFCFFFCYIEKALWIRF